MPEERIYVQFSERKIGSNECTIITLHFQRCVVKLIS